MCVCVWRHTPVTVFEFRVAVVRHVGLYLKYFSYIQLCQNDVFYVSAKSGANISNHCLVAQFC